MAPIQPRLGGLIPTGFFYAENVCIHGALVKSIHQMTYIKVVIIFVSDSGHQLHSDIWDDMSSEENASRTHFLCQEQETSGPQYNINCLDLTLVYLL